MKKVLEGVKVIDFSLAASGPVSSKILSEYGAQVTLVEPLDGTQTRVGAPHSYDFLVGGKRSIPLNIKTPEGMEIMTRLLKQADVFQSNFRAKALHKLGLSYEDVRKINPSIVYGTIDGYGKNGPGKDDPGYDVMCFWARGGLQRDMSPKGTLMPSPVTVGDTTTGMALALGICGALYHKSVTGEGSCVHASLLASALFVNNDCFIESQYGDVYPRSHDTSRRALMNTYVCKDGEAVSILTTNFERDFNNVMKAVGREDLVGDPRWSCIEDTMYEKAPELIAILDDAFAQITQQEAMERLRPIDIGLDVVQSTLDTMSDPQVLANKLFVEYTTADGKNLKVPTPPCRIGEDDEPVSQVLGPDLGEHTIEVLRECNFTEDEIQSMVGANIVVAKK